MTMFRQTSNTNATTSCGSFANASSMIMNGDTANAVSIFVLGLLSVLCLSVVRLIRISKPTTKTPA